MPAIPEIGRTVLSIVLLLLHYILEKVLTFSISILILYSVLHKVGLVQRIIHKVAEIELSKILNDAPVSIGRIKVDILYGQVWVNDLIIHSPQRDDWKWDAPLIARVGKISASLNILSILINEWYRPIPGFPCRDIHSVVVADVQVFIEKRLNIFNFHLCDPTLDIPNAQFVLERMKQQQQQQQNQQQKQQNQQQQKQQQGKGEKDKNQNSQKEKKNMTTGSNYPSTGSLGMLETTLEKGNRNDILLSDDDDDDDYNNNNNDDNWDDDMMLIGGDGSENDKTPRNAFMPLSNRTKNKKKHNHNHQHRRHHLRIQNSSIGAEAKANELVTQVIGAVSSIGEAANDRGLEGLHSALRNQKLGFISHLRQFQKAHVGGNTPIFDEQTAKEGMRVMKHVTRVVEKNVVDIKEQVDLFQRPPPKKKEFENKVETDLFRIGRIMLSDLRIFTKEMIKIHTGATNITTTTTTSQNDNDGDNNNNHDDDDDGLAGTTSPRFKSNTSTTTPTTTPTTTRSGHNSKTKQQQQQQKLTPNTSGWTKPILIRNVSISSAELCPPLSLKDENGLPAIAQTIDMIIDLLIKRLVAEMAKTQSGRLLTTAFGDVHSSSSSSLLLLSSSSRMEVNEDGEEPIVFA